jgi:acetolactate synthase-1/2/3 large subunit
VTREWLSVAATDVGDVIVSALAHGGVDRLFFTSGSELVFYQEAIAKATAHRTPTPELITCTHEHTALNAALGYAAVTGKPAAVAAHADVGTQHWGGAVHTAAHAGLPILLTAGLPASAYPNSMPGARGTQGHTWLQQTYDQNSIVRQYMKWDWRLASHENAGLVISRALQVARADPPGPVYLSIPSEVPLQRIDGGSFPTAIQLGLPVPDAPDSDATAEIANRLVAADNPFLVVGRSGRDPATVPALQQLCHLAGMPVAQSAKKSYLSYPQSDPLYQGRADLSGADFILGVDVDVPWGIGPEQPPDSAFVAVVDGDPVRSRIPILEYTADIRVRSGALAFVRALTEEVRRRASRGDLARFDERRAHWHSAHRKRRKDVQDRVLALGSATPIHPDFLSWEISRVLGGDGVIFDDTIASNQIHDYLQRDRPGSYFYNPGGSGGWAPGAALGAKLALGDTDVVAITGDGFYMFGTPIHSLWAARRYSAPYLTLVYQDGRWSTGTDRLQEAYPSGYAVRAGYPGGILDPRIDFAVEAEAAGAYGENVADPSEIAGALERGLRCIRGGQAAVIAFQIGRPPSEHDPSSAVAEP